MQNGFIHANYSVCTGAFLPLAHTFFNMTNLFKIIPNVGNIKSVTLTI